LYSPTGSGAGSDWFLTQLFGYLGACLAACVVLDFDEAQTVSALGLACMQVAGGKEAGFGVGSTGRAIYPAFAAMGGVHAALLAKCGVVGPASALDGAAGLFKIYLQGGLGEAQSAVLLAPEGWQFSRTQVKPWPSCRLSHPYVSAALGLRAQAGDARWRRVEIAVNASAAKLCAPLAERRRPQTLQDAKYSVPYMTAFTLVTGRVDLSTLNLDALADAQVLALTDRIEIVERLPDGPGHPPAEVRAEMLDGRVFTAVASNFDLSEAGVRDKFDACLAFAGRADKAAVLWEGLAGIDDAKDLDFLFA
ncbi:MAG: hypothetical protein JWP52_670, partial [Rhizobacter sp.]|nr:hypothetical protein [Rhizobacter sp.]